MDLPSPEKREILMMSAFAGLAAMGLNEQPVDPHRFQSSSLSRKTPEQRAALRKRRKTERMNKKRGRR